jgi:nucleoside transporter
MNDSSTASPFSRGLNARLSVMMFLQYAIWGSWLPLLFPYLMNHLGMEPGKVGNVFAVGAIGAIVGPFFVGQVADRYLSTEKLLGLLHLAGAGVMYLLIGAETYSQWLWMSLVYGLVYAPTLSLTNSLALAHLPNRDRDFGRVRVWGTLGWIAVGIGVGHWLLANHTPDGAETVVVAAAQDAGRIDAFKLAMWLGLAMGVYCFSLPNTPPAGSEESNAATKAMGSFRKQPLVTLLVISFVISIVHQFFFVYTSDFLSSYGRDAAASINKVFGVGGGGLMTIGQMSEVLVLGFMIPFLASRMSRKNLLAIGLCAYAGRMALFAYTDSLPAILFGIALHGLCFGCFIFVAFMVVDEETSDDVRASAQSLYNLIIIGVGVGLGSIVSGQLGNWAKEGDVMNYPKLFSTVMYMALACLVAHLMLYPSGKRSETN